MSEPKPCLVQRCRAPVVPFHHWPLCDAHHHEFHDSGEARRIRASRTTPTIELLALGDFVRRVSAEILNHGNGEP